MLVYEITNSEKSFTLELELIILLQIKDVQVMNVCVHPSSYFPHAINMSIQSETSCHGCHFVRHTGISEVVWTDN